MNQKSKILIVISVLILILISSHASARGPFRFMGDGKINIGRGSYQTIKFRNGDGTYNKDGLSHINKIYGTDYQKPEERMSLRLIELLDYLEDHFKGKRIEIISGYRSPTHNNNLRNKGKLAASSSLHIDAEAIDIVMEGVASKTLNDYLIPENCCGVGYYHGRAIHIDTGPPRFWDEKTSGTEKKEPPQNENITVKTDRDYYGDGASAHLSFSRVNDYPIGVNKTVLLTCQSQKNDFKKKLTANFIDSAKEGEKGCVKLANRKEGREITVFLPNIKKVSEEADCRLTAYFCDPKTEKMPDLVESNPFIIGDPKSNF